MAYRVITNEIAQEIKAAIWNGTRQHIIAEEYSISQMSVSRIANGKQYYNAPWPDGRVGPLPRDRAIMINRRRAGATAERHTGRPNPIMEATLERVLAGSVPSSVSDEKFMKTMRDVGESGVPLEPVPLNVDESELASEKEVLLLFKDRKHKLFLANLKKDKNLMKAARIVLPLTSNPIPENVQRLAIDTAEELAKHGDPIKGKGQTKNLGRHRTNHKT